MNRRFWLVTIVCLAFSNLAFSQVNSAISGTVEDASKALIPGVSIVALNNATGVETRTISNESGVYNLPSLLPGNYKLSASLPGFKTHTFSDVELTQGTPLRLNFVLQIGEVASQVDVIVGADSLLAAQGASIGEVLAVSRIENLPIVSNDILDLARILPGFRESPGGSTLDTFAGTSSGTVNVTRDGVSVNDGRFNVGAFTTTQTNPDLVGEIRLILTPVDAELGRGNSQIQITTRSGTNRFTGSAVWNVRNSALDARTWLQNSTNATRDWFNQNEYTVSYGGPIIKNKTFFFALWDQRMRNERATVTAAVLSDTARMGVFRYFDGWTPTYFGRAPTPVSSQPVATRVFPSVDELGNPVLPGWNATGPATPGTYTGRGLMCFSVFGNSVIDPGNGAMRPFADADCQSGGLPVTVLRPASSPTAAWDANRPTIDTTGYIYKNLLQQMPKANYFGVPTSALTPDGLNTASHRWLRGKTATGSITNTANGDDIRQINFKVDHHFSEMHKANVSFTQEWNNSATGVTTWPNGVSGEVQGSPRVLAATVTSTLGPTMLNEARFGIRYNKRDSIQPINTQQGKDANLADYLLTTGPDPGFTRGVGQTGKVFFSPGVSGTSSYNFGGSNFVFDTGADDFGNVTTLYTFGDTFSWTKGTHSFKFGGEYRPTKSKGYGIPQPFISASGPVVPGATTGPVNPSPLAAGTTGDFTAFTNVGTLSLVRTNASQLLYTLAGNIENVVMNYWIDNFKDVEEQLWQSPITQAHPIRTVVSNEASGFIKDDWKVTRNLTLNLGVRWEYYGPAYISEGLTTTPVGRGEGLFGAGRGSGDPFDGWLAPGGAQPIFLSGYGSAAANPLSCTTGGTPQNGSLPTPSCDPANMTAFEFVGPNTPNPGKTTSSRDTNNFGPAIGFSYQVPFLPRTTVRGGYSIQYGGTGRSASTSAGGTTAIFGSTPGQSSLISTATQLNQAFPGQILSLSDMERITPPIPTSPRFPGVSSALPIYSRGASVTAYDNAYADPYTQNFNLSVTTNVRRNMTLDVRYVGTQSRKLLSDVDLNANNIYYNKELFEAFNVTRAGGDAPLLTDMLAGLNLNQSITGGPLNGPSGTAYGTIGTRVGGVYQTGSMHLRRNSTFNTNLLNGNFLAVAQSLASFVPTTAQGNAGVANIGGVVPAGRLLRNGCDRIANTGTRSFGVADDNGRVAQLVCLPENYMFLNPQLNAANYRTNSGSGNYHSMQVQFTLRPVHGFSAQTTYTWAKNMVTPGSGNRDLGNRRADYSRNYASVAGDLRTNGTIELPIGPNKLLFGNTSGWVARLIEGWQTSFVLNLATGSPRSILAGTGLNYGNTNALTLTTSGANITPDVVGPWPFRKGEVVWDGATNSGTYFGNELVQVTDPQCGISNVTDRMGWNLGNSAVSSVNCGLQAIARPVDPSTPGAVTITENGVTQTIQYLLVNPMPGTSGTLGQKTVESAGAFRFDANVQKRFQISESRSLQIRVDAQNVLNHPTAGSALQPGTPTSYSINSDNFGLFTGGKTGSREFRASLRLNF